MQLIYSANNVSSVIKTDYGHKICWLQQIRAQSSFNPKSLEFWTKNGGHRFGNTASENVSNSERRAVCCPAGSAKAICKDNTGKRTKLLVPWRQSCLQPLYLLYEAHWAKVVVRANLLFASDTCKYETLLLLVLPPFLTFCLNACIMKDTNSIILIFLQEKLRTQLMVLPQRQCNSHLSVCLLCAPGGKTKQTGPSVHLTLV